YLHDGVPDPSQSIAGHFRSERNNPGVLSQVRKDVLQSLFQEKDVSGKHEQTIESACQTNSPGIGLDHLDIFPPVFFDALSCVDANHRAELDTDHLTRWADGMNEVRKTPARPATHVENTIALL